MSYQETLGGIGEQIDTEGAAKDALLASALSDDLADDEAIAALQEAVATANTKASSLEYTVAQQKQRLVNKNATIVRLRAERDQALADLAECQGTTQKK